MIRRFFSRWKASGHARYDLNYLMSHIGPQSPIRERLNWLIELLQWARSPGSVTMTGLNFDSGQAQNLRVRFLLQSFDRNLEWKLRASQTLRSILRDTQALDLFSSVGLPSEHGLLSEAWERLLIKFLPQAPKDNDLGEIFYSLFPSPQDAAWLEKISSETLIDISALVSFESSQEKKRMEHYEKGYGRCPTYID